MRRRGTLQGRWVWWILLWVPAGFFMTGVQYALTDFKNITSAGVHLSTHVADGYAETDS